MLLLLPVLSLACLWATITFYAEENIRVPVGLVDLDRSAFSALIAERMAEKNDSVRLFPVEEALLRDLIRNGTLEAAIIIEEGFSSKISAGDADGLITLVCSPFGISRGLLTELLTAQVSRLYFASASASAALREQQPRIVGEDERTAFWTEAFQYADSFWEPEPLMSVQFEVLSTEVLSAGNSGTQRTDTGIINPDDNINANNKNANTIMSAPPNALALVNTLLQKALRAAFFSYVLLCILFCFGTVITERENGLLLRIRSCGIPVRQWLLLSAMVPYLLFALPAAVLYAVLLSPGSSLLPLFSLLLFSVPGVLIAYRVKNSSAWRTSAALLVLAHFLISLL